jgi:hypothetical protein
MENLLLTTCSARLGHARENMLHERGVSLAVSMLSNFAWCQQVASIISTRFYHRIFFARKKRSIKEASARLIVELKRIHARLNEFPF